MTIRWLPLLCAVAFAGCERQPDYPREVGYEESTVNAQAEDPQPSPGTIEAEKMRRVRGAELTVAESVRGFRVMHGRYPETLRELVSEDILDELPDLPEGYQYEYDSSEGEVTVVAVDE